MGWVRNLLNAAKPDWERAWMACRAFGSDGEWERAVLWGRIASDQNAKSAEVALSVRTSISAVPPENERM